MNQYQKRDQVPDWKPCNLIGYNNWSRSCAKAVSTTCSAVILFFFLFFFCVRCVLEMPALHCPALFWTQHVPLKSVGTAGKASQMQPYPFKYIQLHSNGKGWVWQPSTWAFIIISVLLQKYLQLFYILKSNSIHMQ